MNLARIIASLVLMLGTSMFTRDLLAEEPGSPLTYQEECKVVLLTTMNAVMGGLSRDADEQMQRLTEFYGAQMKDPAFKEQLKDCELPGNLSVDQQNLLIELATCRYRDLLLSEYEHDRVPVPDKLVELCQDND